METKFNIKIIWIQTSMDEIENKIQLKKKTIKRIKTKFNIKIKWYQMIRDKIKKNKKYKLQSK